MLALTREFICVADEVGRLQRGKDKECRLFQKIAEQGHYSGRERPTSTRQGMYVTTADGRLLASINHRDPRRIERMLRKALAAWEELTPADRAKSAGLTVKTTHRLERKAPKDGLVLRVISRDVGRDTELEAMKASDWRRYAWNADQAWFTREEARSMVPLLDAPTDEPHVIQKVLAERIARHHLVDNVRGQTTGYRPQHVERAHLESEVESRIGDLVVIILRGESRTDQKGSWAVSGKGEKKPDVSRGLEIKLLGRAIYDLKQEKFLAFEVVGLGERWGGTRYNARTDDLEKAPIGFLFSLHEGPDRVAPASFWHYGW